MRGFAVVVVNDGSDETYRKAFQAVPLPAAVLSYPGNRGKGHALKFGMAYLQGRAEADDILVTLDSDGQHTEVDKAKTSNPRTSIGILGPLHYVYVVADGRTKASAGVSLCELSVGCCLAGVF